MPANLNPKTAIITGASSGIGRATALLLAEAGVQVVLVSRQGDSLQELADQILSGGGTAIAIPTNITDCQQVQTMVQTALDKLGRIDILINSAGLIDVAPTVEASVDRWQQLIQVNLLGTMYCCHAVAPVMQEQHLGHIVNVSSVAGRTASAGVSAYNASKWGVGAFSEALRQELCQSGVRVTVVEPGWVETPLYDEIAGPAMQERISRWQEGIGEPLLPEDVAGAIGFALSQPQRVNVNEILLRPTGQVN
ncbi:SDR family oxidoreductase [Laspinema olomoucense]|uniref:SDR family oxidoreductase n=1 Tax=Laspinema olomoucense TaxID=3231600 RepID=UPI0021BB3B3F|nr:SDR family oxidoreductase [Laspinema sp. D3d]MCT7973406.1 SDR family oxidoreductase [Laspinema sp. D3d]